MAAGVFSELVPHPYVGAPNVVHHFTAPPGAGAVNPGPSKSSVSASIIVPATLRVG